MWKRAQPKYRRQFWANFLSDKDFNNRNLAVTMLHRSTGKYLAYDPYQPDAKEWQKYVNSLAPAKSEGEEDSDEDDDDEGSE